MLANLATSERQNPDLLHGIPLQTDREVLFVCINELRNAYTSAGDRQPLCFDRGERRGSTRIPLRIPVRVTPVVVDGDSVWLTGEESIEIPADTTNLSLRGLGICHALPLPHRHVAVTFKVPGSADISILVELRWTSSADEGRLLSGARFLGLTELPSSVLN